MAPLTVNEIAIITAVVVGMVLLFVVAWRTRLPPLEIPPNLRPQPDWPPYPRALWIVWAVGYAAVLVAVILGGAFAQPMVAQVGLGLYLITLVVRWVGRSWQLRRFKAAKRRQAETSTGRVTDVEP